MPEKAKESQASAARELALIQRALDASAIVAITDRQGLITHVNEKFCQISRYPKEELLGRNHRIINSGHHGPEFFRELWATIHSGKIWEGEIRNRARDGTFYWVHTTIVPFLNEEGEPYQYVSIRYEITQRKEAEEQLRVYADRLERSNRELTDFASIAAHDLQEPLRKIQAFGDRLQTRFAPQLPDEARDFLSRMLSSAGRMRRLIDDLLQYSRVATRGNAFQATPLREVVQGVLSDLELLLEQSGGKVELAPLPTIEADASQMRQLFQNLISNAIKFHRPGLPPSVRIWGEERNGICELFCQDQGIGFEEKYLDRIFTIFQRLHGRQEYDGTGVGLAVCRRIVERHGGVITAQSRPGEGACFMIRLPLRQGKERA